MSANLLNFRQPRTAISLAFVVLLHGLALIYLQFHARKVWSVDSATIALPTISLRLLPLVLESATSLQPTSSTQREKLVSARSTAPLVLLHSTTNTSDLTPMLPPSETLLEAAAPPLNLNLNKRDWTDSTLRKLPEQLPTPTQMTHGAWQQFAKTLGPPEEVKEERLSINRVRIHSKYGCYEIEQTATKRVDPFNWSPQLVTNCRY